MENYFKLNEGKKQEKLRNTENYKIMKLAWKFRHFHFPCLQETEKTSEIYDKNFDFIERLKELISWSGLKNENTDEHLILLQPFLRIAYTTFYNKKGTISGASRKR